MNAYEIISRKRDGQSLSIEEIKFFIDGYTNGKIPDYQMSALLMAIYFHDMDFKETHNLTKIMLNSGEVVDLSDIPGIKVDKHSTGGVGAGQLAPAAPLERPFPFVFLSVMSSCSASGSVFHVPATGSR